MTPSEAEVEVKDEDVNAKRRKSNSYSTTGIGVSVNGSIAVYRGEGNANVVLALPSERRVIRFRKSSSPNKEPVSSDGGRSRTLREVDFLKYVISGFLGNYIQPPEALRVTREEITKINEAVRPVRPEHRLSKEIVEEYATAFTDYAFLRKETTAILRSPDRMPTFCVEIKPKQGFRLRNDVQFRKCTYCLTQYHKLKVGAISSPSSYCPFDLFSGSKERVKKSLRALLDSPQNNLKIFKNGIVVYDQNSPTGTAEKVLAEWFAFGDTPRTYDQNLDAFSRLVSEALLREFSTDCKGIRSSSISESTPHCLENRARIDPDIVERAKRILSCSEECDFTGDRIPQGSVLGRILGMQRLPYHSSDTVHRIYSKHSGLLNDESFYSRMIEMCRVARSKVSVRSEDVSLRTAVQILLESSSPSLKQDKEDSDNNGNDNHQTENEGRPTDSRNNNNRLRDEIDFKEFEILKNYLLSTTAKDCSVLMAFQEIDETDLTQVAEPSIVQSPDGVRFVVNVGVLDLDPKSVHCVEKHRLRDTNVLLSVVDLLDKEIDRKVSNLRS